MGAVVGTLTMGERRGGRPEERHMGMYTHNLKKNVSTHILIYENNTTYA